MIDIEERLRHLIARGYHLIRRYDSTGQVVVVVGVRTRDGVVDVVHLYSAQDANAVRMPDGEPVSLFPRTVLWRSIGAAADVLDAVLGLDDPTEDA